MGLDREMECVAVRLFILPFLLVCAAWVTAQELSTFSNGEVADAEKINENFNSLDERILSLEVPETRDTYGQLNVDVDCEENPQGLETTISEMAHLDPLRISVVGDCNFSNGFTPIGRQVVIAGEYGAEIKPKLLLGDAFFQAKNSGIDFEDVDIEVGSVFNLAQSASVTLRRVNFIGPSASNILVRAASNLRLIDSLQTEVRPAIKVTAGTVWIRSVFGETLLEEVSAVVGSNIWCRICNVVIDTISLDTNSSFCASQSYDLSDQTEPKHLGLNNLSVQANSVFIHEGAPSEEPDYSVSLSSGAIAEWNQQATRSRCEFR